MAKHLYQAKKLEENGMIARAERLHAEVAWAEAEREDKRAGRNEEIARTALSRVKIESLVAVYDFDVALAELLEAGGESERFESYRTRADLEVSF
jgi:hypothetical protein